MRYDPRFAESIAELRLAASMPSPDAALISACEQYVRLNMEVFVREPRTKAECGMPLPVVAESRALARMISDKQPLTAAGRRAKAGAALASLENCRGTRNRMAAAALRDYLANDAVSRPLMAGQMPANDLIAWEYHERSMAAQYRRLSDDDKFAVQEFVKGKFKDGGCGRP